MRLFITISITAVTLALMALTLNCTKTGHSDKNFSIGVVLKSSDNPFYDEIEKGIRKTAEKNNIKIAVLSPERRDEEEQEKLLKKILALKIDALLLAPISETKCIPHIAAANGKKIPVILLDTGIDEDMAKSLGAHVECLITSDNVKGGKLAAEYLSLKLEGKGAILLVQGDPNSYGSRRRRNGFLDEIKKYSAMKVINSPPAEFRRAKAFEVTQKILRKHNDIRGVFALNDLMALGVSDALKVTKSENVCIVGFDATETGLKALQENRIDATITQNPGEIGRLAVENIQKVRRGEKIPPLIFTRTELITREKLQLPFQ